ncbi:MAG: hypothetical protein JJU35_03215 [Balneolales bacterium]|nr:hypothetical protein [Balneolales bacterium]
MEKFPSIIGFGIFKSWWLFLLWNHNGMAGALVRKLLMYGRAEAKSSLSAEGISGAVFSCSQYFVFSRGFWFT